MDSSVFRGDSGPMPLDFMGESGREPNDFIGDVSLDSVDGDVCCVLGVLEGDSWRDLTGEPSLEPFCASNSVSGLSLVGEPEVSIGSSCVESFTGDLDGEVGRLDFLRELFLSGVLGGVFFSGEVGRLVFMGDVLPSALSGDTDPLPRLTGFSGALINISSSGVKLFLGALMGL